MCGIRFHLKRNCYFLYL